MIQGFWPEKIENLCFLFAEMGEDEGGVGFMVEWFSSGI